MGDAWPNMDEIVDESIPFTCIGFQSELPNTQPSVHVFLDGSAVWDASTSGSGGCFGQRCADVTPSLRYAPRHNR